MSDVNPDSKDESKAGKTEGVNFSERYSDVMGKVNESLSKIDWTQMGKYGKAAGIIAVVVLARTDFNSSNSDVHPPFASQDRLDWREKK